jgi:arylsulfatase A-like enzyme
VSADRSARTGPSRDAAPSLPDIVLVVFDTARRDRFGCYGYGSPTTPTTDSLARAGTVVDAMITNAPWTLPSHASLFTGLYPSQHGAQWQTGRQLNAGVRVTLAEFLRGAGYETVCATSNGLISAGTGLARGFDHHVHRSDLQHGWKEKARRVQKFAMGGDSGGQVINGWLRERLPSIRKPMFLFVNYLECHWPYAPPRRLHRLVGGPRFGPIDDLRFRLTLPQRVGPWDAIGTADPEALEVYSALYDGEHRNVDGYLDELLDILAGSGHLRDGETVVMVTSDHGDHVGEHGLADHQASLDDHLINVPFVAWGPGILPERRATSIYEFVDVLPSVAALLGIEQPEGIPEGRRTGLLGAAETGGDGVAFAEWRAWAPEDLARVSARHPHYNFAPLVRDLVCARDERFKLVERGDGTRALFDLMADPQEDRDVADSHPDDIARLSRAIEREKASWISMAAAAGGDEAALSGEQEDEIERHLADLGYL